MTHKNPGADAATQEILLRASAFFRRHEQDAAIRRTYGYFTRHPVAPVNRKRLRHLLDACEDQSRKSGRNLRVLDLACGGGLITCAAAMMGHRVLGVDLDPQEIRMAQLFAGEEKLDGMFLQADLLGNPDWEKRVEEILGGKPDVVTLGYALHHLPRVEEFLARLAAWLPQGARLVINEENPESPLFRLKHRVRTWIQRDTDTEWHRTFPGWKSALEQAGFEVDARPTGADPLPGLARLDPSRCWSLVFSARRR